MNKTITYYISVLLFLAMASTNAWAGSLSVTPLDGGTTIRFGKIDEGFGIDKEVKIRVNGFEGQQYQVYQRIEQPPMNARGEYLDRNALLSQGTSGSNATGSLHINSYERLSSGDQLIYTSNASGASDIFRMLYTVNAKDLKTTGRFQGRIIYLVRPFGGGLQEEVVLNIYLEVDEDFSFEMGADFGSDSIDLKTNRLDESDSIRISFDGFRGNKLKVRQEFVEPLVNEDGRPLTQGVLQFYTMNEKEGDAYFTDVTDVGYAPETIYETQTLSDSLHVYFLLNPDSVETLNSGVYRGKVRFLLETDWSVEARDFDITVESSPLFEMDIVYPSQGMGFDKILPDMPAQEKVVIVKVKTNLGRPYTVSQNMSTPLQNERGEEIEKDYFLIRGELLGASKGSIKHPSFVPVVVNDTVLYQSDREGSPGEFQVIYQLKPYASIKAGDYKTAIRYSLGEQ